MGAVISNEVRDLPKCTYRAALFLDLTDLDMFRPVKSFENIY
jgi:hypothetical protein